MRSLVHSCTVYELGLELETKKRGHVPCVPCALRARTTAQLHNCTTARRPRPHLVARGREDAGFRASRVPTARDGRPAATPRARGADFARWPRERRDRRGRVRARFRSIERTNGRSPAGQIVTRAADLRRLMAQLPRTHAASAARRRVDTDELVALTRHGMTTESIADVFGVQPRAIEQARRRRGVPKYPVVSHDEIVEIILGLDPPPGPMDGYRHVAGRIRFVALALVARVASPRPPEEALSCSDF